MTDNQKILNALKADQMTPHALGVAALTAGLCGNGALAADLYAMQAAKTGPHGEDLTACGHLTATGFQPVVGPHMTIKLEG